MVDRDDKPETEQFSNRLSMVSYLHCGRCLAEVQEIAEREGSASPREYAQLEVGWTRWGLQVWCRRHECNMVHIDFEGQKHPAITTAPADA